MEELTDRLLLPKDGGVASPGVLGCDPSQNECLISPALAQVIACWTSRRERGSRR